MASRLQCDLETEFVAEYKTKLKKNAYSNGELYMSYHFLKMHILGDYEWLII